MGGAVPLIRPEKQGRARRWSVAVAFATAIAVAAAYTWPWAASRWRAARRAAALLSNLPEEFHRLAEGAVASVGRGGWCGEVRAGAVVGRASFSWDRALVRQGEAIVLDHPVIEFIAPTYRVIASAGSGEIQFESISDGWPMALRLDGCATLTAYPPGEPSAADITAEAAAITLDLLSLTAMASGGCRLAMDGGVLATETLRVRLDKRDLRPLSAVIDAGRIVAETRGTARENQERISGRSREARAWLGAREGMRISTEGRVRWDSDGCSISAGRADATIAFDTLGRASEASALASAAAASGGAACARIEWSAPLEVGRVEPAALAEGVRSGVVLEGVGSAGFEFLDRKARLYASAARAEFDFVSRVLTLESTIEARPARVLIADGARLESCRFEFDAEQTRMTGIGAGALILEGAAGTIRDGGSRHPAPARSLRWKSGFEAVIDRPVVSGESGAGGSFRGVMPRMMRAWGGASLASDAGRLTGDDISVSWSQACGSDGVHRMAMSQIRASGWARFDSADGRTSAAADRLLVVIDHSPAEARDAPLIFAATGDAVMRTADIEACGHAVSAHVDISRQGRFLLERVHAQGGAQITRSGSDAAAGERVDLDFSPGVAQAR